MATKFNLTESAAVAAEAIAMDMKISNTFRRDFDAALRGVAKGRTIDYQIPGVVKAFVRDIDNVTDPVAVASLEEGSVPVTISDHIGSVVVLSEGQKALDLRSFSEQVAIPQAEAVAFDIESKAVAALAAEPLRTGYTYDATNPKPRSTDRLCPVGGVGE